MKLDGLREFFPALIQNSGLWDSEDVMVAWMIHIQSRRATTSSRTTKFISRRRLNFTPIKKTQRRNRNMSSRCKTWKVSCWDRWPRAFTKSRRKGTWTKWTSTNKWLPSCQSWQARPTPTDQKTRSLSHSREWWKTLPSKIPPCGKNDHNFYIS